MTTRPATLDWRLLHLADSALPTGAYAFSNGLEAAAKIGLIRNFDDLRTFFRGATRQVAEYEGAFLAAAHELSEVKEGSEMVGEYDASVLVPEMRHASAKLATTWLRLMDDLYGPESRRHCLELLGTEGCRHYPLVFGKSMAVAGHSREAAIHLFLYGAVRDQVSAAIRLGLLGPSRGHSMIHSLAGELPQILGEPPPWREAYRSYPILDVAQAAHATLYSRLFQN